MPTMPTTDFRNITIENHWNDPPNAIFNKNSKPAVRDEQCCNTIADSLRSILSDCEREFTSGPNKRIFMDTKNRINILLTELDKQSIPDHVVHSLSDLCQALVEKDWERSIEIHTQLMTAEYDKFGSWLTGLKRLIDLSQKVSS
ncbi:hypothetical protein BX666DRAFT_1946304 [Dichotomocladium elegans]|nr:hypothetical protein BX666DRAFT_1946304 [Dichotomocladium elegans]